MYTILTIHKKLKFFLFFVISAATTTTTNFNQSPYLYLNEPQIDAPIYHTLEPAATSTSASSSASAATSTLHMFDNALAPYYDLDSYAPFKNKNTQTECHLEDTYQ